MRKPLFESCRLPDLKGREDESAVTREFEFRLITPMFGGDSESWELNLKAPVRAQSVKGQLRFWWRTMQSEPDRARLLEMENGIWGGNTAEGRIQSRVKIAVLNQNATKKHHADLNDSGYAVRDEVIPAYVAFPVTSAIKKEAREVFYVEELTFTLRVSYPATIEETVLDTLKLWTIFGGVGARTRRGCGSVHCEKLMEGFPDENAVAAFAKGFGDRAETLAYPGLQGARLAFSATNQDPAAAWTDLIGAYSRFRQDRRPARPTPGRSYWPEPDAIRTLLGSHAPLHAPEHPDGVWFPRAAFGLPIITQFNTRGNGAGDPHPPVELKPPTGTGERWPSPMILKVILLSGERALKTALVLDQAFPERLVLKQGRREIPVPRQGHPFAPEANANIMKTRPGANRGQGESIYQAMFRELNLEEVQ